MSGSQDGSNDRGSAIGHRSLSTCYRYNCSCEQVKLKLDGKELPKPRLSDAVQNSDKAIGHAISNSTVATSAKRFDVYLKQLSNETVRKYDTPEFVETVKKLQMGIVHGSPTPTILPEQRLIHPPSTISLRPVDERCHGVPLLPCSTQGRPTALLDMGSPLPRSVGSPYCLA